jgi:hypothetical protein
MQLDAFITCFEQIRIRFITVLNATGIRNERHHEILSAVGPNRKTVISQHYGESANPSKHENCYYMYTYYIDSV